MAAAFPYRGVPAAMPPGVPPGVPTAVPPGVSLPAPVPDYMSEEKLQEKGMLFVSTKAGLPCFELLAKMLSQMDKINFAIIKCLSTLQQENGSSYRQSATQKRESLALWMLRRKICHLNMSARSSGTMET